MLVILIIIYYKGPQDETQSLWSIKSQKKRQNKQKKNKKTNERHWYDVIFTLTQAQSVLHILCLVHQSHSMSYRHLLLLSVVSLLVAHSHPKWKKKKHLCIHIHINFIHFNYRIYLCISGPFTGWKSVQKITLNLYMGQKLPKKNSRQIFFMWPWCTWKKVLR